MTIINGGAVSVTNSALQVDGPLGIDGNLALQPGAQVVATNAFTSIGFNLGATGQVVMTDGTAIFSRLIVGSNTLSVGTFTMNAGSLFVSSLFIGLGSNAVGSAWISDCALTVTNSFLIGERKTTGQLTLSNTTAHVRDISVAGSLESQGTFTMAGSTVTFSSGFTAGGTKSTGTVFVSDGQLTITNGNLSIGVNDGIGQMTITNGLASAPQLNVGFGNTQGQGTLTAIDSSLVISNVAAIGSGSNSTGTLWLINSQLQFTGVTNGILVPVGSGVGQVILSKNSSVSVGSAWLGTGGTLSIQSGTVSIVSNFSVSSKGTVWMADGQLYVSDGVMSMGQVTISNGFVSVPDALIASASAASTGTLAVVGGSFSACSSLVIGDCSSNAIGQVLLGGGALIVTNAGQPAFIDLQNGTLTVNSGSLITDKLVMTNSCGHFVKNGGSVVISTLQLDPALDADGDGIPNGYEQSHGLDPLDPVNATLDSDGDGQTDLQEYLAGTDPTNSASAFRITSVVRTGNDIFVTWMTGIGRTNALQVAPAAGDSVDDTRAGGGYDTNGFADVFTVTNTVGATTNYLDLGAATNVLSRYYRVRLVP
ncbi:MAG TPA: thrombospondin type 3 repeat-containing protein [Verrucomicrobiae bacterium]|nr:thrombospondin type 3 repeat-containing protein [Verrucomicrobiae bacterium]